MAGKASVIQEVCACSAKKRGGGEDEAGTKRVLGSLQVSIGLLHSYISALTGRFNHRLRELLLGSKMLSVLFSDLQYAYLNIVAMLRRVQQ